MFKQLSIVTLISLVPMANADQLDPIVNMAVKQLEMSGELSGISACVGVSETRFIEVYRPILRSCLGQFGNAAKNDENEAAMDKCFETEMIRRFDISATKLSGCKEKFADDDELDQDEDEDEEIDYSEMSDEEYEALMAKQRQQNKERLDMMLEASKAASKGTEHLITLPVYQQSEIVAHYPQGIQFGEGEMSLPVATFSSTDSVETIVAFYTKKLPGYQSKTFEGGMVIFMQDIPKGFEPLANMDVYQHTPHVAVYSFANKKDPSIKTTIEIAYNKSAALTSRD